MKFPLLTLLLFILTVVLPWRDASAQVLPADPPLPAHTFTAASPVNDETTWLDDIGGRSWPLNGVVLNRPLAAPSPGSLITASYQSIDSVSATGVSGPSYQYGSVTVELWVRPDLTQLSDGHQMIFEAGGGQNGAAVLITDTAVRFLGSSGNTRTVDIAIPTAGFVLDDFLQIVYVIDGTARTFTASVRDVAGRSVVQNAAGRVVHGSNIAGLFRVTGNEVNLGGRTEAAGSTPAGYTGFAGEIAVLNVYDSAFTEEQIATAWKSLIPENEELIQSFTGSASPVPSGTPVTLSWRVANGLESLTLLDGQGESTDVLTSTTNGKGSLTVTPEAPVVYTLRAVKAGQIKSLDTAVFVGTPVIQSFASTAKWFPEGGAATLSWNVNGADTLRLDPGALDVTGTASLEVFPEATTVYTLTATNILGASASRLTIRISDAPAPAHSYNAVSPVNDETVWVDDIKGRNWPLNTVTLHRPLGNPGAGSSIEAAYQISGESAAGITVPGFQYANATVELWVRPDLSLIGGEPQLVFESGGNQNGSSVFLTSSGVRLLGSTGNVRTVDLTLPLAGFELGDFIQIVYSINGPDGLFHATLRDAAGRVLKAEGTARASHGTDASGLFGGVGGTTIGGAGLEGAPEGWTAFTGEITVLNVYDRTLTEEETETETAFRAYVAEKPVLLTSFGSDVEIAAPGVPVTLSWRVSPDLTALTLIDDLGVSTNLLTQTVDGAGSLTVSPSSPVIYTLKAARGPVLQSLSVSVYAGPPVITSFQAAGIRLLKGESTTLSWKVKGAVSLTVNGSAVTPGAEGELAVTPEADTTYTLTAVNPSGGVSVDVPVRVSEFPLPAHRYQAWAEDNDEAVWADLEGGRDWPVSGVVFHRPLAVPSGVKGIGGSYQSPDGFSGGALATGFVLTDFAVELWIRPDKSLLGPDHQLLFESGGGQNGTSVLLSENGLRFLGSKGNKRNLDEVLPLTGLSLDDFIQVVYSYSSQEQTVTLSVRDATGAEVTRSAQAAITHGANSASLFQLGSSENNLGGRTDLPDVTPEGLTGFSGEIALLNVYDRALSAEAVVNAYQAVAGAEPQPPADPVDISVDSVVFDPATRRLTAAWNAQAGAWYQAEYSTDLIEWRPLEEAFQASDGERAFTLPEGLPAAFVRIRTATAP